MASMDKRSLGKIPNIVRDNPISATIISKLNRENSVKSADPLQSNIPDIAMSTYSKIQNNDDIVKMFPDIELCIQILVSSIISPNDMTSSKLSYKAPDLKLPPDIKMSIVDLIKTHIDKNYNIDNKLATILREALFTKGSYIEAIIPEASLDDVISQHNYTGNVSIEQFFRDKLQPTYDFLGPSTESGSVRISTEEYANFDFKVEKSTVGPNKKVDIVITQEDLNIEITDNPRVLTMYQHILKSKQKETLEKIYHGRISTENDTLDKYFREASYYKQKDVVNVLIKDDASRESVGKPLVFKLPTESVIPVHVVNDPSKHLGYFVLLDQTGAPVNAAAQSEDYEKSTYDLDKGQGEKMGLVSKAYEALYGMTKDDVKLDNLEEMYSTLVENMIKKKLSQGLFGELVTIKENADIFRVMLYRALRNQQTKILFLPSELVAYYAFEYRDNGTGKSLMEKASILYSIRSILLFTRIMASIKNSTTVTEVQATLDEHDPDPDKRVDQIKSEVLKSRQALLPLGVIRPDDLADWTHKLGLRFKIQHPSFPNVDISTSDVNSSKVLPDDELERIIKEAIIMSYGLTPEIVESGYGSDFATTVVAKNMLTAKRVTRIQEQFTPLVSEHIRKIARNDMELINSIKELIDNNKKPINTFIKKMKNDKSEEGFNKLKQTEITDYITNVFINEIEVTLPEPQPYEANSVKNAFDDYKTMIEETADIIFSSDALPDEYAGQISGKIDTIKGIFKSVLFRKWMLDNNYMTEIGDFLTKDEEGKPVFNILEDYSEFVNTVTEAFIPFLKTRLKDKNKMDQKLEKAEEDGNNTDSGSDDSSYDDNNDDEEGGEEPTEGEEPNTEEEGNEEGTVEESEGATEGEGTGAEEETEEEQGGDGMDMGDMDMDMGMGDEGGDGDTADNFDKTKEQKNELDVELKKIRVEKEKALADKAKADAKLALDKAGLEPSENNTEEGEDNVEGNEETDQEGQQEQEPNTDVQEEEKQEEKEPELEGEDNVGGDSAAIKVPKYSSPIFL